MLHHSSLYCNPIIHHLLPRCQRSMALTTAVLCFQASQVGGVESFAKFDKAMVLYRSMPSAEDITYVLDTGLIICNASVCCRAAGENMALTRTDAFRLQVDDTAPSPLLPCRSFTLFQWQRRRHRLRKTIGSAGIHGFRFVDHGKADAIQTCMGHVVPGRQWNRTNYWLATVIAGPDGTVLFGNGHFCRYPTVDNDSDDARYCFCKTPYLASLRYCNPVTHAHHALCHSE